MKSALITMVSAVASAKFLTAASLSASNKGTTRLPALTPEVTTLAGVVALAIASSVVSVLLMVKVTFFRS